MTPVRVVWFQGDNAATEASAPAAPNGGQAHPAAAEGVLWAMGISSGFFTVLMRIPSLI